MSPIIVLDGAFETNIPGSFVVWDAEAPRPAAEASSDRVTALVGEADGGEPLRVYRFSDPEQARAVLLRGELLDAVKRQFTNGAKNGGRPRAVFAVNVRGGTPAQYSYLDNVGDVVFTLQTRAYRELANNTQTTVSGSQAAGFNIQVKDSTTNMASGNTQLGLGLYVQYGGIGSAATAQVVSNLGRKVLRTLVAGRPQDNLEFDLEGLSIAQLVVSLNATGIYSAKAARDGTLLASELDVMTTAVDILQYPVVASSSAVVTAAGAASITLSAATTAFIPAQTLRFYSGGRFIPVVTAGAAIGATTLPITPIADPIPASSALFGASANTARALTATKGDIRLFFTNRARSVLAYVEGPSALAPVAVSARFVGGGSLPANINDWGKAVKLLLRKRFANLTPLTDDAAIQAAIRGQLQSARSPETGKWIELYTGIDYTRLPDTDNLSELEGFAAEMRAEISAINDRDSRMVIQGADMVSFVTGQLERQKPYMVAATLAGLRASMDRSESLTYQTLAATNPWPRLDREDSDGRRILNDLVKGGAMMFDQPTDEGAARVVLGRTSYVGADNPTYEYEKTTGVMNSIAATVRDIQDATIPGASSKSAIVLYEKDLERFLERIKKAGWITEGVDEDGEQVDAYNYEIGRTTFQGRKLSTRIYANPTPELTVGEARITARLIDIEV